MKFEIHHRKITGSTWAKYELTKDYVHDRRIPGIKQYSNTAGSWVFDHGHLTILAGTKHDGASGPTVDDLWNEAAAALHDVGYRITMAMGFSERAPREAMRLAWDREFRRMLIEKIDDIVEPYKTHGLWGKIKTATVRRGLRIRAAYYYKAVRLFGEDAMLGAWRSRYRKILASTCTPGMFKNLPVCSS